MLSFLIPGLGQIYRGELGLGLLCLVATLIGYAAFIVPGIILHLASIIGAAKTPAATRR